MNRRSLLLIFVLCQLAYSGSIEVYIAAPGVQSTPITGATNVTFNSISTGRKTTDITTAIGTYDLSPTNPLQVVAADQYGGANNSRYIAFGAQTGTSAAIALTLLGPRTYFGFWWSAGDANNAVSFYSDGQLLARIPTLEITQLLPRNGTVTAINGTVYQNNNYYGNPNAPSGRNTGEPYAYVIFVARDLTFNRIVFDNSGTTSTGFESDNHSVRDGVISVPGSLVLVKEVPFVVPEPATFGTAGAAIALLFVLRRRARARR